MNAKFIFDTRFNAVDYAMIVEDLADSYFYSNGEYAPHVGLINSMRIFYNRCVKECKFDEDIPHNTNSLSDVAKLAADEDFIEAYNHALMCGGVRLDFANAYKDALAIVDVKKGSLNRFVDIVKNAIDKNLSRLESVLTEENIAALQKIAESFSKGIPLSESIVDAYIKKKAHISNSGDK